MTLRLATAKDSDNLFAWRNDPVTQACSRSTAPVARDEHERWMTGNVMLGFPEHMVLIAESERGPLGVVRFDGIKGDDLALAVSITIAPKHRGQGLARGILSEACASMSDYTIHAEVRKENRASRRLFARCGFDEIGRSGDFLSYRREPVT